MTNGDAGGVRRGRGATRLLLGGLVVLAAIIVIGGGIVLFLATLVR